MKLRADSATAQRQTQSYSQPTRPAPEFPGCRPVTVTREDMDDYEERLEYWDADTEIAWVVREPPGRAHERPPQDLAKLCAVIAAVRGAPIECCGAVDLELRRVQGERWRILQADQAVYLHPWQARLPEADSIVVGEHDLPDVVLEVDNTTDVRRGKLGLYEEWGFPEVWVDVPEAASANRPASRRPGLSIHLLAEGVYRPATVSRAFPGWTAAEIHVALNEPVLSAATGRVLARVSRALGEREGTGPDDTPWLHWQREEGRAKGQTEGRAEGRAETLKILMRKVLGRDARGLDLTGVNDEAVIDALLQCEDEADFHARLRDLRR